MSTEMQIKTNAKGFRYHWPTIIYAVEYRHNGQWERIADYWDKGQAEKCCRNFAATRYQARIRTVPQ